MSLSLSRLWLAARVGAWLFTLPLLLRIRTLPLLLRQLASQETSGCNARELNETVQLVSRVARLRLFELSVFPRLCLRRSLALYSVLTRMGYPAAIHFGVRKNGCDLHGHSWVTLYGAALGERISGEVFRTIYAYPSDSNRSSSAEIGELRAS
jgi:hypothetical protein